MILNTLLLAFATLLTPREESKAYHIEVWEEQQDLYDFAHNGLYYEIIGEDQVKLVREKSLVISYESECSPQCIWRNAYEREVNQCYEGDIIVPDSVVFQGKKYGVVGINQYSLSFSLGLKSVTFTTPIKVEDNFDHQTTTLFYNLDLEKVVYHDSMPRINYNLNWAPSLKHVHFPYMLNAVRHTLIGTGLRDIDLDNHGDYNPSTFTVFDCFEFSSDLRRVKFPVCDTLAIQSCEFELCPSMEQIVFRPCKHITQHPEILSDLYKRIEAPIKVISESTTPPEVNCYESDVHPEYRGKAILYVPDESIEAYGAAEYWRDFGEIRPMSQYIAEEAAAIESMAPDGEESAEVTVSSNGAEMRVEVSVPAEVTVWSLQGQPLWSGTVKDEVTITLPKDVYIITTPSSARKYRH